MTILELFELLGVDTEPKDTWAYIDYLIQTSTLSEEVKTEMEQYNSPDTAPEVMEVMLRQLYDSRPDNIQGGHNYSQTDIKRKLDQL